MTVIISQVKDGKPQLTPQQQRTIDQTYKKLEGQEVRIEIDKPKRDRTNRQNNYLWGVVYKYIADDVGHTVEEVHEEMKDKLLPREFVVINGLERMVEKTTTILTIKGFNDYIEQVIAFAGTLNISIPPAGHE